MFSSIYLINIYIYIYNCLLCHYQFISSFCVPHEMRYSGEMLGYVWFSRNVKQNAEKKKVKKKENMNELLDILQTRFICLNSNVKMKEYVSFKVILFISIFLLDFFYYTMSQPESFFSAFCLSFLLFRNQTQLKDIFMNIF